MLLLLDIDDKENAPPTTPKKNQESVLDGSINAESGGKSPVKK